MARITKPLTNTQVDKAKATDKPYKLSDGEGLYLYVSTNGTKSWRIDYTRPVTKKRATLTLGKYPDITLAQARQQRAEVKSLLAQDIDPQKQRKEDERQKLLEANNTFEAIAKEYIDRQTHLSSGTLKNNRRYAKYLNEFIGSTPITQIRPIDVLDACRHIESKGYLETAKKMRSLAGQVFRYAVQTARAERDVTHDLQGALKTPEVQHFSAITDPKEFGRLLRAIDDYQGTFETKIALQLMPMLFVRSGELRHAKWEDFDLEEETWSFTPRKTKRKTGVSLIVPLPTQAVMLLKQLQEHKRSDYLFPAIHTTTQPMSENTMSQALKRLGYTGEQQTIHGFRASARTIIVERLKPSGNSKYDEELVEMQLGHVVKDMHGRAYNRTTFLDDRRDMMQKWADYIDRLKSQG
ncbi:tyrosine-type recombinase/integrase [Psychrobacter sp. I-STPA6b]|uniref:tyrosine-type recombinase/integrase n=1 Tax=Psychrobacter sp. I-STPA6b TaxID=2585718 RepID=UPI001D0C9342|nr:integrase arm-type DNA-binding domain-containing protein [Psychrobacter sp. I-STPA6b]